MTSEGNTLTLRIRLIRSFEHRNIRFIVVRNIDPSGQLTGKELKELIRKRSLIEEKRFFNIGLSHLELQNESLPPPFKTFAFGTDEQ